MPKEATSVERRGLPGPVLRRALALGVLVGGLLLTPPAAGAAPSDPRWTVRAFALGIYPEGDELVELLFAVHGPGGRQEFSVSDGTGFGLGLERRLGRRFGIEAAVFAGDLEAEFRLVTGGAPALVERKDLATETYLLGATYHLTPGRRADVSVGLFVAMAFFDDVTFASGIGSFGKLAFDDDIGFGAKVGVDFPFTPAGAWSVSAEVRYLDLILEGEMAGQDLGIDELVPAVGIALRF